MHKVLIDTSTFFDIRRAAKKGRYAWAQNTLRNFLHYQAHHPKLSVSAFTVFEYLDGLYREARPNPVEVFSTQILPGLDVIFPDQEIMALGAEINATLTNAMLSIGVVDSLIAATAIVRKITLVNANTKHFPRVQSVGFRLVLENWRDV